MSNAGLRKYSYASVSVYPFRYHAASGRLIRYDSARVTIHYDLPPPGSGEALRVESLKWDAAADERASRLFVNYEEIRALYRPEIPSPDMVREAHDYVIVTADTLSAAIGASRFLSWKESLGYRVRTVLITDPEIAGQPGRDLAEQIRNFLRSRYGSWGIRYVLLVGDYATIPMRYCFPDSSNHEYRPGWPLGDSGEVPTDAYYADLSDPDRDSWDSDGDGYYGEYGQDHPDFLAEVYVGRIPTDDPARITYTLDKLVAFEQDTGAWKDRALQAGAMLYFTNEDRTGYGPMDGATSMNRIETDLMDGWMISHYSEQEGLEPSLYDWPALNHEAFVGDWRSGQYGVVNWAGHGMPFNVTRKIWSWDDGDGVPESGFPNEIRSSTFVNGGSTLEDDYPSILFAISCLVGYPEQTLFGNLGIDLLTKPDFGPSVGVLSSNRTAWIAIEWSLPLGGAESMCYEFNRHLINGPDGPEMTGAALYDSKFFCHQNYGWDHFAEYLNLYDYNLYGDPALVREGVSALVLDDSDAEFTVLDGAWVSRPHANAFGSDAHIAPAGPDRVSAGWRVDASIDPGTYDVFVWKFEHEDLSLMATDAPYRVYHGSGMSDWIDVDQSAPGTGWVPLGRFEFDDSHAQGIVITNRADGYVIADAVKLVRVASGAARVTERPQLPAPSPRR